MKALPASSTLTPSFASSLQKVRKQEHLGAEGTLRYMMMMIVALICCVTLILTKDNVKWGVIEKQLLLNGMFRSAG